MSFSDSTCSHESCSICETNSSADDESEKSWTGKEKSTNSIAKVKSRNVLQNEQQSSNQRTETPKATKYRKHIQKSKSPNSGSSSNTNNNLSKVRINIPKPELKVSHYSKNTANTRKLQNESNKTSAVSNYSSSKAVISRSASEVDFNEINSPTYRESKTKPQNSFSTDYVNHISSAEMVDPLKYQQTKIEKIPRPLPRVPFVTIPQMLQPIPQHHHVVDVVPKPHARQSEWNVPDQTIGIPITNPTPILNFHDLPSLDSTLNYPRQTVLMPSHMQIATGPMLLHPKPPMMLTKSKSMHTIPINQPIIHHPLVSGHIPSSMHSIENYLVKKQIPFDAPPLPLPPKPRNNTNISSSILASTSQQNPQQKRENGEKNKVKFSDTVTVAVVPVRLTNLC